MAGVKPPQQFNIDARAARWRFTRTAVATPADDVLAREVEQRMAARLQLMTLQPTRILDVGSGAATALPLLRQRYADAAIVAVDLVPERIRHVGARATTVMDRLNSVLRRRRAPHIHAVAADMTKLPFAHGQFELLWSNLALNWSDSMPDTLAEWRRVVAIGGLVMFSAYGPDTLRELRAVCAATAPGARVHGFVDMHDIGDMLVAAGFADPVMDMEHITLTYGTFEALVADLRTTGQTNVLSARPRGMLGRGTAQALRAAYDAHRVAGRLPATVEVIYGHAWKPAARVIADGRAVVQFTPPAAGRRFKR